MILTVRIAVWRGAPVRMERLWMIRDSAYHSMSVRASSMAKRYPLGKHCSGVPSTGEFSTLLLILIIIATLFRFTIWSLLWKRWDNVFAALWVILARFLSLGFKKPLAPICCVVSDHHGENNGYPNRWIRAKIILGLSKIPLSLLIKSSWGLDPCLAVGSEPSQWASVVCLTLVWL